MNFRIDAWLAYFLRGGGRGEINIYCRGSKILAPRPREGVLEIVSITEMIVLCFRNTSLLLHCLMHSSIHLFIHSFINLFNNSFIHLFIHSFIHSFIPSFLHSFIHSFIHSYIAGVFVCIISWAHLWYSETRRLQNDTGVFQKACILFGRSWGVVNMKEAKHGQLAETKTWTSYARRDCIRLFKGKLRGTSWVACRGFGLHETVLHMWAVLFLK